MKTVRNMLALCVMMVVASGLWLGKSPAPSPLEETVGCTKQEGAAVLSIVTSTGQCVAPIVVQGLMAGLPAAAIVDAALACGGATVEAILAFVESLMVPPAAEAGVEAGALGASATSAEMQQRLAALHFELVNRVANKKAGAK